MRLKSLLLFACLLCYANYAPAQSCAMSAASNPLGIRLANLALHEYAEFNGHRIDADGHLWKSGSVESETELLYDPDTGTAATDRSGRFAWRRVWEYWLTLDRHVPGEALSRKLIFVPELLENPATTEKPDEIRLKTLLSNLVTDDPAAASALREVAVRAALNDSPWSATFIAYLMDRLGLTDRQFHYSSAHWQYIQRAFEQPPGYAFKACDPRRTPPRIGDLLCYARGASSLKSFAEWRQAVREPGFRAGSHCEVVVHVDRDAKKMETIGGNVLQSVARRKLKLDQENLLSDAYHPDRVKARKGSECARDKTCERENLNVQYWGILLQLQ